MLVAGPRSAERARRPRTHAGGEKKNLERDAERAMRLIVGIPQIGQRRGIALGTRRLRDTKGCERLGRDHPGCDGRMETSLARKGPSG